ncbi:MAG: hypothetical protein WC530_01400 [Candidatus Omnitrophota bacterium]|jgi:hypothetical protein
MKLTKIDLFNVLIFAGLLAIFYPGLVIAKQASLMGDHWEQHYPWAFLMAQSLKQGTEFFWTPLIQCGFPIVAESQMGLFYIPNLLLYAALPIEWAYAYMNLLHFYIAAVGTYLYARQVGINSWGAFVAAIVFVFGTGYGGAYYNITSLKTLSWFPWILYWSEKFIQIRRPRYLVFMAASLSFSILAGYLQIAVLMALVFLIWIILRVGVFNPEKMSWPHCARLLLGTACAVVATLSIALPQIILTHELSLFSNRVNLSEAYAYVGSLSPFSILTIVFPKLQGIFRGNCLYSGIFAVVFVIASFFVASKGLRKMLWLWVVLCITSLFFALGQWSPLYVSLVKLTHFYSFRVPAKFLVFFCFGVAMLAGIGVHAIMEDLKKNTIKKNAFADCCLSFALAALALWGVTYFCLTRGRSWLESFGKWIVENFIYGKPGHPRRLESYLQTINAAVDAARGTMSFVDPWQIWAIVLIVLSCVWILFLRRTNRVVFLLPIAIIILLADLYVFAGADIKKDFDSYAHVMRPDPLVKMLLEEKNRGSLERVYGFRSENESLPLMPSVNMIYGIEDIGGYSPLIMRRYYETIGLFGNVNDSNSMNAPEVTFVLKRLPLLNALDVSHVLSKTVLEAPDLHLMFHDLVSDTYLYKNTGNHGRAYFVSNVVLFPDWFRLKEIFMAPGFDPQKTLLLEDTEMEELKDGFRLAPLSQARKIAREHHTGNSEHWTVEITGPGFFVLSNVMYPGWEARLNGRKVPILKAYGLFQAIWIPRPGTHSVELSYKPFRSILEAWGCCCRLFAQCPLRRLFRGQLR